MNLTRLAIYRPLTILMFILGLVIMGLVSMRLMRVDRLPNITFPFVGVNITYPGTAPTDIEALIAKIAENGLAGVPGVFTLGSNSFEGRAFISLQLYEGADADQAAIQADRRMAAIRARLPTDIGAITVNKADPNASPIINIAVTGRRPIDQIFDLTDKLIAPRLASVIGVADVSILGGIQQQVTITVDYDKLNAYGVTIAQLQAALQRENVGLPAGSVAEGERNINVRTTGEFQTPADMGNLVISIGANGGRILLRDIASVAYGFKEQTRIMRYDGQESVGLSITKQSDANTIQVSDDVRTTLNAIQRTMPQDVRLVIVNDTSRYTRKSLEVVQKDLLLAIGLTAFVLLLFLHTWRNVFIVICAIPTSLISTFLIMYALGFSINLMTLMALALVIGVLVDDSIVVLENIHRHIALGEQPMLAALKGRAEIGLAAIAITMCDVVVYLPVAFMQGNIGKLFKEYGLTVATATLFSLLISFTLTPMLASRWLKSHDAHDGHKQKNLWERFTDAWERGFVWWGQRYRSILNWSLHHRPVIIVIGLLSLVGAYAFFPLRLVGTEYAPNEDDGMFRVSIQTPPGTNLTTTDAVVRQIEAILQKTTYVEGVFTSVGSAGFSVGSNQANITVQLAENEHRSKSVFDIIADLRRQTARIPNVSVVYNVENPLVTGGPAGLFIRLTGESLDTLIEIADRVEEGTRRIDGVADVRNNARTALPELRTTLDRSKMADLGISAQQVANAVRISVGGLVVSQFRPQGRDQVDIMLIASDKDRLDLDKLAAIPLVTTGSLANTGLNAPIGQGNVVRLGQIATFERTSGPSQIQRADRVRVVTLSGTTAGRPLGEVLTDFRAMMNGLAMPPGYTYILAGQAQQLEQAMTALGGALGLSLLLIYMLLVALYESWLHPLAIMFSIPVALVGAIGGLWLTGNTFNIFSMIGMIMLMGIVAKNAILLVDYTNTLRQRGYERLQALLEAGPTRLKPIIMTTATIVFAMLPLALKFEAGAESRAPLAVVVLGGIATSTILTLVLVPCVYTYFDDMQHFFSNLRFPSWRHKVETREAAPLRERIDAAADD